MNRISFETRLAYVKRLYSLLTRIEHKCGGTRLLATCNGRDLWPKRGVYFFFEPEEMRLTSGGGNRIVRVGTHALKAGGEQTLWNRLSTHKGNIGGHHPGGGNHRGSIFRRHIGSALIGRDNWPSPIRDTWGEGNNAPRSVRNTEYPLEKAVSSYIRNMPFLWVEVDDAPGPDSKRGYIERNAIALLSNALHPDHPIDPPNQNWLGNWASSVEVCHSGLWNVQHVFDAIDPGFLDYLENIL